MGRAIAEDPAGTATLTLAMPNLAKPLEVQLEISGCAEIYDRHSSNCENHECVCLAI